MSVEYEINCDVSESAFFKEDICMQDGSWNACNFIKTALLSYKVGIRLCSDNDRLSLILLFH